MIQQKIMRFNWSNKKSWDSIDPTKNHEIQLIQQKFMRFNWSKLQTIMWILWSIPARQRLCMYGIHTLYREKRRIMCCWLRRWGRILGWWHVTLITRSPLPDAFIYVCAYMHALVKVRMGASCCDFTWAMKSDSHVLILCLTNTHSLTHSHSLSLSLSLSKTMLIPLVLHRHKETLLYTISLSTLRTRTYIHTHYETDHSTHILCRMACFYPLHDTKWLAFTLTA